MRQRHLPTTRQVTRRHPALCSRLKMRAVQRLRTPMTNTLVHGMRRSGFLRDNRQRSMLALDAACHDDVSRDSIGLLQTLLSDNRMASQFEAFSDIYIDDIVLGLSDVTLTRDIGGKARKRLDETSPYYQCYLSAIGSAKDTPSAAHGRSIFDLTGATSGGNNVSTTCSAPALHVFACMVLFDAVKLTTVVGAPSAYRLLAWC